MSTPVTELWKRQLAEMTDAAAKADAAAADIRPALTKTSARLTELDARERELVAELEQIRTEMIQLTGKRDRYAAELATATADAETARTLAARMQEEGAEAVRLIATQTGPLPVQPEQARPSAEALTAALRAEGERMPARPPLSPETARWDEDGASEPAHQQRPEELPSAVPPATPVAGPAAQEAALETRPQEVPPPPGGPFPAAEPVVDRAGTPGPQGPQNGVNAPEKDGDQR